MTTSISQDVQNVPLDIELNYRRYLVKILTVLALPILAGFMVFDIFVQRYFVALILFLMILVILFLYYLVQKPTHKSKEDLYYQYFFAFFFILFGFYLAYSIGIEGKLSRIPWAYLFPVVVFFALGEMKALLWVTILYSALLFLGMQFTPKEHIVIDEMKLRFYISFSFVILFSYLFERLKRKYQRDLISNQTILKESENRYREAYENLKNEMKDRKRAEEALRESENRYRLVVEDMPAMICRFKPDGTLTFVNSAYCEYFHMNKEKLIGQNFFQFIPTEDRKKVKNNFKSLIPEKSMITYEHQVIAPGGNIVWQEWTDRALFDDAGNLTEYQSIGQDITERKMAEEELIRSEARLKEAQKIAHVGDWVYNMETEKVSWSEEMRRITGIGSSVKASLKTLLNLVHPDDRKIIELSIKEAREEDKPYDVEYRLIRTDGAERIIHSRAGVVRSEDDRPLRMVGATQDITEQRRIEADLKEAYDIIKKSPAVVFLWKNQEGWPVELVTDNVKELFGYTAEELISGVVPYSETVHPDDLDRVAGEVSNYSAERGRQRFTHNPYRIVCKNGKVKWVDDRTYIRRDEEGNITHYQGIVIDVTNSKKAEEALKKSEEKFRDLAEQSPNMIFINKGGKVVYANKRCEEMMRYTRDKFYAPDFDFFALIAPESKEIIKKNFMRHMNGEEIEPYEYTLINKAGEKINSIITSKLIEYEAEPAILGIVTDITDRKKMEEEREALIAELEAKNEELERFTYTVSHDLKSPLITIKGFLGLLENDAAKGNTERFKSDITRIANAADNMQNMLSDLLELSRIGRVVNPPEKLLFTELLNEVLESMSSTIEKRKVQIQISPNLPAIMGDRLRVKELLQNLIENSVKYLGEQPEPHIEIDSRQEDTETIYYIKDNGMGIDHRDQEKVFGLFEKLDPRVEGTGIGLALAKRIIELHGGRIWVESEGLSKGSTFCFTIPGDSKTLSQQGGGL
jgi:PAS domain S-box-containing protein